ncbi:MAG TPA: gluconokinase [Trichormus sp.]
MTSPSAAGSNRQSPSVVVIMGVSGSGKSTIGTMLAQSLGWDYLEGDSFHSAANVEKMTAGIPLTDEDRAPWLKAIGDAVQALRQDGRCVVLACSALKHSYRELLRIDPDTVAFVYLQADFALLQKRLNDRRGHFMKVDMLASQLETLEPPGDALYVQAADPPDQLIGEIKDKLALAAAKN